MSNATQAQNLLNNNPHSNTPVGSAVQSCPAQLCTVQTMVITCAHGRKIDVAKGNPTRGNERVLQVLATDEEPETINVEFENCGCDNNKSKTNPNGQRFWTLVPNEKILCCPYVVVRDDINSRAATHPAKLELRPRPVAIEEVGFERFFDHYSLLDLQPTRYTVLGSSCKGVGTPKALIEVFPNASLSFSIDLTCENVEKENKPSKVTTKPTKRKKKHSTKTQTQKEGETKLVFDIGAELQFGSNKKTIEFSLEKEKKLNELFKVVKNVVKFYSSLSDHAAKKSKGNRKLAITWPKIGIEGNIEYAEATEHWMVGKQGGVTISLDPLIGGEFTYDILGWVIDQLVPFSKFVSGIKDELLEKIKKIPQLELETVLEMNFGVMGNGVAGELTFEKAVAQDWQAKGEVSVDTKFTLEAKTEVRGSYMKVGLGAGGTLALANKDGSGDVSIKGHLAASSGKQSPIDGAIEFGGATIIYAVYADVGVKEKEGGKSNVPSEIKVKVKASTEKRGILLSLLDDFTWPSTPPKVVQVN